jgi:mRNA interferase HigB
MPSFEGIKHRSYGWTHERRERAQAPGRSLRSPARASPGFAKWELRAIENWLADVESAVWTTPQDIRRRYASASFLPQGVVVFNVKGNAYRLEVSVAYRTGVVVIEWIGTHREYDERNKRR